MQRSVTPLKRLVSSALMNVRGRISMGNQTRMITQAAANPLGPGPTGEHHLHFIEHTVAKSPPTTEKRIQEAVAEWEQNVDTSNFTETDNEIHRAHLKAVKAGQDYYVDPVTGFQVFTILTHLRRAECCGNLCRHCPYGYVNVPDRYRDVKKYNSSFYS